MDVRPGKDRDRSEANDFVLVKTEAFLKVYRELLPRRPRTILEIGMFEGGSLVFFDKLFRPEKLVGLDIRRDPIEPLEEFRRSNPHIRTFYGLSQDDERLPEILGAEFPGGIDMIVDDASHLYSLSRASFHLTFPLLNPGGLYVLEDWQWSHQQAHQNEGHPWHDKPALTNLVFEIIVALPVNRAIDRITIHPNLIVVEKSSNADGGRVDLARAHDRLRGRTMPMI